MSGVPVQFQCNISPDKKHCVIAFMCGPMVYQISLPIEDMQKIIDIALQQLRTAQDVRVMLCDNLGRPKS